MPKHTDVPKILFLHRISSLITEMFGLDLDCALDWVQKLSDDVASEAPTDTLLRHVWEAEAAVARAKGRKLADKYCASPLTTRDIASGLLLSPNMRAGTAFPFSHIAEKDAYIDYVKAHFDL